MLRTIAACGVLALALAQAAPAAAHPEPEYTECVPQEAPSLLSYGFKGFWLGGELGLSLGWLSTRPTFDDGDWRNLVFGTGLGALAGVGAGVVLAMIDTGTRPPSTGWYVLRDGGYGTLLGGLAGAAVGALFVIDSGQPKDILTGAAIGSLVGAAVGVAFGLIEAQATHRERDREKPAAERRSRRERTFWFDLQTMPALGPGIAPKLLPGLTGRF